MSLDKILCVVNVGLRVEDCQLQNPSQLTRKRACTGSLHNLIDAFVFTGGRNLSAQLFHYHQTNTGLDRGDNWSNTMKCEE